MQFEALKFSPEDHGSLLKPNILKADESSVSPAIANHSQSPVVISPINEGITLSSQPTLDSTLNPANSPIPENVLKGLHGTFELKFLIDDRKSLEVMAWARQHLNPDPHCDPDFGDGYHVNSLYVDTPAFDVFHRTVGFRQQKLRLRRYGRESVIWFEQKRKRKGLVRKRRISVVESDISSRLTHAADQDWDGNWFRKKIENRGLQPVCQITYQRFARLKSTKDGPIRLTIDNCLTAVQADGWKVPDSPIHGVPLLEGKQILELKFRDAMPGLFLQLIEQQQLQLTSFSKYRTGVEMCVLLDSTASQVVRGPGNA